MAAQVFKRSFWYWDKTNGDKEEEEEEKPITNKEKKQQSSRKAKLHMVSHSRSGVVVLLGWMLSERKHLASFTRLYKSIGWDCLVCHPHVLNLFFPSMATSLALSILLELVKDLERHPCPIVFITFSGGHKACLYKIIQILLGQCREVNEDEGKFKVVAESVAGLIFDSSPMEFESNIGAKVLSQQMLTLKPGRSNAIISHGAHALGRGLDTIFFKQFGLQRVDLWHALYSAVNIGPILILCSENDELAPLETIHMFSSNLCKLGGKVDVVVWKDSKHVGHFRRHPEQYSIEVRKLLVNASSTYFDRLRRANKHAGSVGDSATTWTNLPECVLCEIDQMSRVPHVRLKEGSAHDAGLRNFSNSSDNANYSSIASQTHGYRSRL